MVLDTGMCNSIVFLNMWGGSDFFFLRFLAIAWSERVVKSVRIGSNPDEVWNGYIPTLVWCINRLTTGWSVVSGTCEMISVLLGKSSLFIFILGLCWCEYLKHTFHRYIDLLASFQWGSDKLPYMARYSSFSIVMGICCSHLRGQLSCRCS